MIYWSQIAINYFADFADAKADVNFVWTLLSQKGFDSQCVRKKEHTIKTRHSDAL